ncbi:MAG: hypothetical protein H6807_07825 [Planctomycetes bacterium]|nr:hypothetical protein [Planctomycetota bacterium]
MKRSLLSVPTLVLFSSLFVLARAQQEIDITAFPRAGASTRVLIETRAGGELVRPAAADKKEKLLIESRIEFVDLVDSSNGKDTAKGKRRYLDWKRTWNGDAVDPEQAGAGLVYERTPESISASGFPGEDISEDCCDAEASSSQLQGFGLEQLTWASTEEEVELRLPGLATLMLGHGGPVGSCKATFRLAAADEKCIRLTGKASVVHEDGHLLDRGTWTWTLDCEYEIDRAAGQLRSVVWKGAGKYEGRRGGEPIEGEVALEARASATIAVDVAKDLARRPKPRDVIRRVHDLDLALVLPSSWAPVADEDLGKGFGNTRCAKEQEAMAVFFTAEPAKGGTKDKKAVLKAVKELMAQDGIVLKTSRSGLGEGLGCEIEEEGAWASIEIYILDDVILRLQAVGTATNKAGCRKSLAAIRKSLKSLR